MSEVMETQSFGTAIPVDLRRNLRIPGEHRTYRLDPPLWGRHEYVVVSAVESGIFGPETYILPVDRDGYMTELNPLPGSFKGGLDYERALRNAGYEVKS